MRCLNAGVVLSAAEPAELTSDPDGRAPQISDLSRPPVCLLDELRGTWQRRTLKSLGQPIAP